MLGAQSFDDYKPQQDNPKHEKKKARQEKQKERIERAQNGRGGALTAVKTPPAKKATNPRPGFFGWLGPGPSEPETDDPADETQTKESTMDKTSKRSEDAERNNMNATSTGGPDLAKLWWVNVWTQQLPDRPENISTDKETSAIPNAETEKPTSKEYQKDDSEARNRPTTFSINQSTPKKKKSGSALPDNFAPDDSTAIDKTATEEKEKPAPNYVSSGYVSAEWNVNLGFWCMEYLISFRVEVGCY